MTSAELIARLKEIDPSGEMTVVEYDGCDNYSDLMSRFIQIRKMYLAEGRRNMNTYYDEYYEGLEPVEVIVL